MSNQDIKVGDICVIVGACCEYARMKYVGMEVTITASPAALSIFLCGACNFSTFDHLCISAPGFDLHPGRHGAPREFLRKKPPKADPDATPRDDFTPADQDFQQDLQRRLAKEHA